MVSKKPRVSATVVNGDRISSLPDATLSHILSFLPTEDSVRTRALSTRWKHLFSLVPVLDFEYPSFNINPYRSFPLVSSSSSSSGRSNSCSPINSEPDRTLDFLAFVDWVFNSYNVQNMERFSFRVSGTHPENSRLLSWISESIRRRVKELHVNVSFHEPQKLPREIFTCKTITNLYICNGIDGHFILDVPEEVCLPHLKTLSVEGLYFIDAGSFRRFFRSFPVLENLFLSCCRSGSGDIQILDISIPSLKKITIKHASEDELDLVLDLPNVEDFTYIGGVIEQGSFSFQGFKLLAEAYIACLAYFSEGREALEKLVSVVCNVRKLNLCWSTLEAFQKSGRSLPIFCNLTHLEIEDISCDDLEFVLDLLDRTPRLEVLVIGNGDYSAEEYAEDHGEISDSIQFPSARVPACVSLNLKEVRFEGFLMLENEFKFAEYLLESAKVLDALKISSRGSLEKQFEMSKKLLTFPRWSRACQIVLDPDIEEYESDSPLS